MSLGHTSGKAPMGSETHHLIRRADEMPDVLTAEDMAELFRVASADSLLKQVQRGVFQGPQPFARRPTRWTKRAVLDWLRRH